MLLNVNKNLQTQLEGWVERDLDNEDSTETFLRSYAGLLESAPELAVEWSEMEEEEQMAQQSLFMSNWGNRYLLGKLYSTGQLTPEQAIRLADLDQRALEGATHLEVIYGSSLGQLISYLIRWGTPLTQRTGFVCLEIPFQSLPKLAHVLMDENAQPMFANVLWHQ